MISLVTGIPVWHCLNNILSLHSKEDSNKSKHHFRSWYCTSSAWPPADQTQTDTSASSGETIRSHFIFPPYTEWIFYFLTSPGALGSFSSHNPPLMSHNTSSKSPLEPTWRRVGAPLDMAKKRLHSPERTEIYNNINFPHFINIRRKKCQPEGHEHIKHPILFMIAINSFNCIDYALLLMRHCLLEYPIPGEMKWKKWRLCQCHTRLWRARPLLSMTGS